MKKGKLSVGLVTSFIGALALTACGESTPSVTAKEGSIIEIADYNGSSEKINISTDLYEELKDKKDGVQKYYNAVLEALIRYEYPKLSQYEGSTLKSITTLENTAAEKVEAAKQTASDNASQNKTSYDDEWKKILDSHDCENESDLKQYYLYDLEKSEITSWHYEQNKEDLQRQFIGVTADWKPVTDGVENVDPVYPYHVLHILVSLSADKSNYIRGTISDSEASLLWQVVRQLIDGEYSFQEIAMNKTNDTGSKDQFGDVEIMSTKTSFYNEFKLGVYAYDAILSGVNSENDNTRAIYRALGLDSEAEVVVETTQASGEVKAGVQNLIAKDMVNDVKTPLGGFTTIPTIPYDVFRKIGEAHDENKIGNFSPESGDVALPRNVLFNQFLNFHSPFVISNEDIINSGDFDDDQVTTVEHDFENGDLKIKTTNFNDNGILTDKDGNVIIGVRSEAGIHFMVMRKSVFEETNKSAGKQGTSLEQYYTTSIPGDEEFPAEGETFVNMKKTSDSSYYVDRANTIKKEITSTSTFDAAYDYRLYEYLTDVNDAVIGSFIKDITYADEGAKEAIADYIKLLRENKHEDGLDSINEAWKSYLAMLDYQNTVRAYDNALVPTECAFSFNEANKDQYKEGGKCYVEAK